MQFVASESLQMSADQIQAYKTVSLRRCMFVNFLLIWLDFQ